MRDATNKDLRRIVESDALFDQLRRELKLGPAAKISRTDGMIIIAEPEPGWSPPAGRTITFSLEGEMLRIAFTVERPGPAVRPRRI